jgi:hypothetical protein
VTGVFVLVLKAGGLSALHFIYGGKFDALFPLLMVLAFLPMIIGVGHTMNAALKAMERPKLVFYGYGVSGAVGAVAGGPLVAHFGVRGAVYGMLLSGAGYTCALAAGLLVALGDEQKNRDAKAVVPKIKTLPAISNKATKLAPIALFVYNREEHTRRTIESLRANDLAAESDLYVFSDGPKSSESKIQVGKVRKYLKDIRGFKSVTVVARENNAGLAKSVIAGVTQLCDEHGRLIAMEDDLLTSRDFLTFMNQGLVHYEHEPRIFSISGFNFGLQALKEHQADAFSFYRSSSLGWGTWRDRWEKADWEVVGYEAFSRDKGWQERFNRGGADLSGMLALQMNGCIDSWAIRWAYEHCRHNALALLSVKPRVFHIGDDGSGTHTRRGSLRQSALTTEHKESFLLPDQLEPQPEFVASLQKSLRPSAARKMARYALRKWRSRKQVITEQDYLPGACSRTQQKRQGLLP